MSHNPVSQSSEAGCSASDGKPLALFGRASEVDDTREEAGGVDAETSPSPAFSLVLADDDESATEDLILCELPPDCSEMTETQPTDVDLHPFVEPSPEREESGKCDEKIAPPIHYDSEAEVQEKPDFRPMPDLPPAGEIAKLGIRRSGSIPRRIGKGKLVPANLSWKPGDPFGKGGSSSKGRFRWELMLTTACLTGACGLVSIWLLRSIFA